MKEYISVALAVVVTVGAPPLHFIVFPVNDQATVLPPVPSCVNANKNEFTPAGIFRNSKLVIFLSKEIGNTVPFAKSKIEIKFEDIAETTDVSEYDLNFT
jgi:hypothetical protein